ncbi:MAG: 4-alpha-glucanotransferase [Cyanobacteria bacterium K_Offshore_0m_m2_072]|nr:4-alpha-glucanotransferase [Cyanobacteria bacterium K_Offshore_0m_m2_072]
MRQAGILLHVSALPGQQGCGSFGAEARDWISLLGRHGIAVWQVLPLAPVDGTGSPYSSPSGSALNPRLLDLASLVEEGWLPAAQAGADLADPQQLQAVAEALRHSWQQASRRQLQAFERWHRHQRHWLDWHCRFMVIKQLQAGKPWWQWSSELAQRRAAALRRLEQEHAGALLQEALLQWHLQRQWQSLRQHGRDCGVQLVGDLPFYVAHDSADVWSRPQLFSISRTGALLQQSGVPPDYFSSTGQLWGTPVYRWGAHWAGGFGWWVKRLLRQLELFDRLRLDHFRALQAYWSVPGNAPTAEHGHWRLSPGWPLLTLLWLACLGRGRLLGDGRLPLIAEDLGVITRGVRWLRDGFALPGMKILQFAFDGDAANPYLPQNYRGRRWVVYTGTHDNATTLGWWQQLDHDSRERVAAAVGGAVQAPGWQLTQLALESTADLAVVPLQDLLELGDDARFNTPGTSSGNWSWRLQQAISSLDGPLQGYGSLAAAAGRGGQL